MARYRLHGVGIRAPLPLGEALDDQRVPPGPPELDIELGAPSPVGTELPPGVPLLDLVVDGRRIHGATLADGVATLRIPALCDFAVDLASGRVVCTPDPVATAGQLVLLVRGSLLAFHLGLRHQCVLHASVVEVAPDGTALAFVAGSGMGKSTLAGLLCGEGGRFVADDLLRLNGGTPPGWVGTSAELRLRPAATGVLHATPTLWPARQTVDGRTATDPPRTANQSGAIAAVVVPFPTRDSGQLTVQRLDAMDAVMLLARFPRLERWLDPGVLEAQLDGIARLAETVPVFSASVPWGPPFPPSVVPDLLAAVGTPGPVGTDRR